MQIITTFISGKKHLIYKAFEIKHRGCVVKKLILLILFIFSLNIYSQTLNLISSPQNKVQVDFSFDKTIYESSALNTSLLSGVYNLGINIPISSKLNILSSLPFARLNYSRNGNELSENGIGNIFVGLQTNPIKLEGRKTIISFGLFLPTVKEGIEYVGIFNNFYNFQSFTQNSLGLYVNLMHEKTSDEGFSYSAELGPNISIPTRNSNNSTEVFLHFGINLGYQINKIKIKQNFLEWQLLLKMLKISETDLSMHLILEYIGEKKM